MRSKKTEEDAHGRAKERVTVLGFYGCAPYFRRGVCRLDLNPREVPRAPELRSLRPRAGPGGVSGADGEREGEPGGQSAQIGKATTNVLCGALVHSIW